MIDAPVSMDPMEKSQCSIVVFSGGQDSTTCLIHALQTESPQTLHCLTFDYGQRHRAEIAVAQTVASVLGITTHLVVDVNVLNSLSISSLTHHHLPLPSQIEAGIPNTFVPGRNIVFLTLAMIYAYQVGAHRVITGVCETDFSGYPDCRAAFVQALNQAVNLGLGRTIAIETPLMALNKAEIWALADAYGQLDLIAQQTLTCYQGLLGNGCGQCPACRLRARGLQQYQADRTGVLTSLKAKMGRL